MKRLQFISVILVMLFGSTYLYGYCEDFFQAGSSMLYKQTQLADSYSDYAYIDTTFACEEGVCFYGILSSGRNKPDVIDGFYNEDEFYFARLIRRASGHGWKEVIHYHGHCDEYDALGEYFGASRNYLGRFLLLR